MRHERDFLETLQTYVKVTQARLKDGRIIDAHEELQVIEKMISQRKEEVNGTAAWESIAEVKEFLEKAEMVEEQACAPEIGEKPPEIIFTDTIEDFRRRGNT